MIFLKYKTGCKQSVQQSEDKYQSKVDTIVNQRCPSSHGRWLDTCSIKKTSKIFPSCGDWKLRKADTVWWVSKMKIGILYSYLMGNPALPGN